MYVALINKNEKPTVMCEYFSSSFYFFLENARQG